MIADGLMALKKLIEADRLAQAYATPDDLIYVNKLTGETYHLKRPADPITATAYSMDSFKAAFVRFRAGESSVYVSVDKVVGVLNDSGDYRRDRVTLPLEINPAVDSLTGYSRFSAKDFVEFLRIHLCGTTLQPSDLRQRVQAVKFESSRNREETAKHGDESVSSSIVAKLAGASDIPETFYVSFPFYPSLVGEIETTVIVQMAIMIDLEQGEFVVRELPGQMQAARVAALRLIQGELAQAIDAPVIMGAL